MPFWHLIPHPVARFHLNGEGFPPQLDEPLDFAALLALPSAVQRSLGRLCGAQQGGACYAATPPSRPPFHPPPPEAPQEGLSITYVWRGQRGCGFRSFPPSLRSVRRSPFAPRKCQMAHLLWIKSVSAEYHTLRCTLQTWPCPHNSRPPKGYPLPHSRYAH